MIDWRHWHNEPILVGGLVLLGWLWAVLAGPFRARLCLRGFAHDNEEDRTSPLSRAGLQVPPFPRRQAVLFYSGLLVFYLAVGSPLDQVAEGYLLSAHMAQHYLLIYAAALLFLLGLPPWMVDAFLSAETGFERVAYLLTRPLSCTLIFLLVFGGWHMPWLYDAALRHKTVHVLEHLMFFGSGLLYWWPLFSPSRIAPRVGYGTQMLVQLGIIIGMMPIHAYITFSHDILYPTYEFAPRLFANFSPRDDQLLAGVSMQIAALFVSLGAIGYSFYQWFQSDERDASNGSDIERRTSNTEHRVS
jgi:putative membrane protein